MKKIITIAAMIASGLASAQTLTESDKALVHQTIDSFADQNGICSVSFDGQVFEVRGTEDKRDSVSFPIDKVSKEGSMLVLSYTDYDGEGEVLLRTLSDGNQLKVVATFEDLELGKDMASFCHMYK